MSIRQDDGSFKTIPHYLVLHAAKEDGKWHIDQHDFQNEGSDSLVKYFLSEHAGAEAIPLSKPKTP